MFFRALPLFIVFSFFVACNNRTISCSDLSQYVYNSENGLTTDIENHGVLCKITLKPSDMVICKECSTLSSLDSIRSRYDEYVYIELIFSGQLPPQIHKKVSSYVFNISHFISLKTDLGDELKILDSYSPRLFGLNNEIVFVFAVEKEQVLNSETIEIEINDFGIQRKFQHTIDLSSFKNIPVIEFKNAV